MERSSHAIARVLPLAEPELHEPLQAKPWAVETKVAFRANEWGNTLCDDVGKAGESEELYHGKQDRGRNLPVEGVTGKEGTADHKNGISSARPNAYVQ
jgi:hypothetical protein